MHIYIYIYMYIYIYIYIYIGTWRLGTWRSKVASSESTLDSRRCGEFAPKAAPRQPKVWGLRTSSCYWRGGQNKYVQTPHLEAPHL